MTPSCASRAAEFECESQTQVTSRLLKNSVGRSASATSCDSRGADDKMLKHFGGATRVKCAASRRRGADSEFFNGLLVS